MKSSSLGVRVVVSTLLAVFITCLIFSVIAWRIVSTRVEQEAAKESAFQSEGVISRLSTIDQLSRAQVDSAMRILEDQSQLKGVPSLKGTAAVGGKTVPDLHLGSESQVLSFAMVDHVKELAGGTATLFVWDGSSFIRVTTNVLKADGSRAVGTALDPKGKAFAALSQGRSFSGVVDILGVPYSTSYVPMLDSSGKLAGAWYTGVRLDSIASLGDLIEKTNILDHGFIALLNPSGAIVFHGKQISAEELGRLLKSPKGWVTHGETYPAWGYTVLTAYPKSDVEARLLGIAGMLVVAAGVLVCVIVVLQFVLLSRLVLHPVSVLTERLANADLNTRIEVKRNDEIGALANGFNQFVQRLRQAMLQVRDGSAATTAKSGEIRGISQSAKTNMAEQCQSAEDAATAIAQLSRDIASTSSRTSEVTEHTRLAADAARRGADQVCSTAALIHGLSQDTQQSASRVASLNERTRQIGSIVGVINEIAAGTNLLALNASIEAARAGEHGRGFAVVAGEVRRLAERTAQATKQVASLVSGIEEETELASRDIMTACTHAASGAEAVSGLGGTFERIAGLVIEVDGRMAQIAQAAQSEAAAANAVSDTMHQVALNTKESAGGAGVIVNAADELLGTAHSLEDMVRQFQLREMPPDHSA
ncbi:MAG: Cache 3/Cache 2 fusion domain-containing protein [Terracidiphilus sp.]|jgi:methyl-accepting chemotaxis protein